MFEHLIQLLNPPTPEERRLIQNLRIKIQNLHSLPDPQSSEAMMTWNVFQKNLRDSILMRDPRYFLDWDFIRLTMFFGGNSVELRALQNSLLWAQFSEAITEDRIGHPPHYRDFPSSSGNLIHHAYSLLQLFEAFNISIHDFKSVFEFGGGYGSMARLFYRLGFTGSFTILDLPEFLFLQEYFLRSVNIPPELPAGHQYSEARIKFVSEENFMGVPMVTNDLFIALWSLSESPITVRTRTLSALTNSRVIIIGYQDIFADINNSSYFEKLTRTMSGYKWRTIPIEHLPGNFYLLGRRI